MTKMLRDKENVVVLIASLGGVVLGSFRNIWSFIVAGICVMIGKYALSKFFEEKK